MASYETEVYPHRHDLNSFVNALLRGLPKAYTENLQMGNSGRRPGSGQVVPQEMDMVRVRALLDAWGGYISGRYLDYRSVRNLDRGFDARLGQSGAIEQARQILTRNAVRFISSELNFDDDISEARMSEQGSYNWMYSALLRWCSRHCYGLVNYIQRYVDMTSGASGGNSGLPIIYQASWQFIHDEFRAGRCVYSRYFTEREISAYFLEIVPSYPVSR